jgi:hypothetical protein
MYSWADMCEECCRISSTALKTWRLSTMRCACVGMCADEMQGCEHQHSIFIVLCN